MPKHVLHISPGSAPCRAVLLHLHLLRELETPDLADLEVRHLDLQAGEHKGDEYLAIHPRGVVPTLETPWGALTESRAIMRYLAELAQVAAPDADTLYPRSLYQRARVNEWLDWDLGSFYKAIGAAVYPKLFGDLEPDHAQLEAVAKAFSVLERELAEKIYVAGPRLTIADLSLAMGATMLRLVNLEVDDSPNVEGWLIRMQSIPGWNEVNAPFEQWHASIHGEDSPSAGADAAHTNAAKGEASPPRPSA